MKNVVIQYRIKQRVFTEHFKIKSQHKKQALLLAEPDSNQDL